MSRLPFLLAALIALFCLAASQDNKDGGDAGGEEGGQVTEPQDTGLECTKTAGGGECGADTKKGYCYAIKKKSGTLVRGCPDSVFQDAYKTQCEILDEGKEAFVAKNTWCCKMTECPAEAFKCGGKPCDKTTYCAATKTENGGVETDCPVGLTVKEKAACNKLESDQEIALENGEKWCCKKETCPGKATMFECGSKICPEATYCVAKKENVTIVTDCPPKDHKKKDDCTKLTDGKTKNLGDNEWCCKAKECKADDGGSSPTDAAVAPTNQTTGAKGAGPTLAILPLAILPLLPYA